MRPTQDITSFVQAQPFFDSHSHMDGMDDGWPADDRRDRHLAEVLLNDYIGYLASACGTVNVPALQAAIRAGDERAAGYEAIAPLLDVLRATTTWRALREGIRTLFPFDSDDLDGREWDRVDRQVRETYRREGARALARRTLEATGVDRQVHICQPGYVFDQPASPPAAGPKILPSLVIDGFCFTGFAHGASSRPWLAAHFPTEPGNLKDYLRACGCMLDAFVAKGGCSIKILAAYGRTLDFEDVDSAEAERLFPRDLASPTGPFPKPLQDFLVHAFLDMAAARRLPLFVHTGYSIPTAWANPAHLHRLFRSPRLKGMNIALVHGGWPDPGEAMIMARTYPTCYLDLAWLPLLSTAESDRILSAAVDIVPLNKIMIGTDCGCPESFIGTVPLVRDSLARVLGGKTEAGEFPVETAKAAAAWILHGAADAFFREGSGTQPQPA